MAFLTEAVVEQALIQQLRDLGYSYATDSEIGPDGPAPERASYGEVNCHFLSRLGPTLVPNHQKISALPRGPGQGAL